MTKPEEYTDRVEAPLHENRAHTRRKLSPMAYVELGQDNGGILLNLSEGGFAVQSALALTSSEFSGFRFQVPALHGWLKASGRVVWMSESKKEAGIQFTELPEEARREILKWVAAEGDLSGAKERTPIPSTEGRKASQRILDTPYRGGGGAHEPAIGYATKTNWTQAESERPTQKEPVGVAVAEPSPQDFRFTDYSMFAAEPATEQIWTEPPRRRGRLRGALLVILVAGLFFALGSTVGRGMLDQGISYIGDWIQDQPPASRVSTPVPPQQASSDGASETRNGPKSDVTDGRTPAEDGASPAAGSTGNSGAGKASDEKKDEETGAGKAEALSGGLRAKDGSAGRPTASSAIAAGAKERGPRHPTENAIPHDSREVEVTAERPATEHSILVNAPGPGSPPFKVNLPEEAVSASAAIAISARRTLEILPAASGRSERVVIGQLISHSEPFYPLEARSRGIQGIVELRARVGRTGQILSVTPIRGPGLLMSAAATAVREWRYEPTFVNGDPAETFADITIVFRLR
jgi:TonB family protein